jgi:hypothetical protein
MTPGRLLTIAAAAVALGGCGAGGASRDERLAREHVERFLHAMEASDDARACATMTPRLRRAITTELRIESEPGTCSSRAADIYSPAKAPGHAGAAISRIEIAGDRATATVAAGDVDSAVMLRRRGDGWLIADF